MDAGLLVAGGEVAGAQVVGSTESGEAVVAAVIVVERPLLPYYTDGVACACCGGDGHSWNDCPWRGRAARLARVALDTTSLAA